MPSFERSTIQITSDSTSARPASLWRFRLVQITILLIACFYADAALTGGVIRREIAQDAENVLTAVRHAHPDLLWLRANEARFSRFL